MDFVTFELAKKLEEKGFKEKCLVYYDVDDNVGLLYNTQYTDDMSPCQYTDLLTSHNTDKAVSSPDDSEYCVDAPTISQALKWLREEKKIHLFVEIADKGWFYTIYPNIRIEDGKLTSDKYILGQVPFKSHEEAEIGGIEHVLDKLI